MSHDSDTIIKLAGAVLSHHDFSTRVIEKFAEKLDDMNSKIDGLEKSVKALSKDTSSSFNNVGGQLTSIQEEIKKIGIATGYNEQVTNLKSIQGGKY